MASSDMSSNGSGYAPLYPQAVIFPILAFPAWLLCLPPLFWHFRQGNIAAGSLIAWFVLNNLSNSINPLIWPRDNLSEWWDGKGWCDINARLQVGSTVAHAACTVMIVRKLAKVMDTRNIVVSSGRNTKLKEKFWTLIWCWAYPMLLVALYYVVQPTRYFILGIIGCRAAYDTSWPSMVLIFMWGPITMMVAAYYAGLLIYRLDRYRCEFQRLVTARNTTKSRFIRLFVISMIIIGIYLPYTLYINVLALGIWQWDTYDWNSIHGPQFTSIIKVPAFGKVSFERWMYVCTGYVIFFVFGTGTDAHSLYKKMLLGIGLGKVFPSLYLTSNGNSSTRPSFIKSWGSSLSTKARSMFSSKSLDTMTSTVDDSTRSNSVVLDSIPRLKQVTTEERVLVSRQQQALPTTKRTLFARLFSRKQNNNGDFVLPLFSRTTDGDVASADKSAAQSSLSGVHAHVWASETSAVGRFSEADGVQVVKEFSQNSTSKDGVDLEEKITAEWT